MTPSPSKSRKAAPVDVALQYYWNRPEKKIDRGHPRKTVGASYTLARPALVVSILSLRRPPRVTSKPDFEPPRLRRCPFLPQISIISVCHDSLVGVSKPTLQPHRAAREDPKKKECWTIPFPFSAFSLHAIRPVTFVCKQRLILLATGRIRVHAYAQHSLHRRTTDPGFLRQTLSPARPSVPSFQNTSAIGSPRTRIVTLLQQACRRARRPLLHEIPSLWQGWSRNTMHIRAKNFSGAGLTTKDKGRKITPV